MRTWIVIIIMVIARVGFADEVELKPIVVYGERPTPQKIESTSSTHIPLSDYDGQIVEVSEIIERQAGVHLTRLGGLTSAASISIRASDPDEVMITLDGIPLNTSDGSNVDLSFLSAAHLESITVTKSASALRAGGVSKVGLVDLKSQKIAPGFKYGAGLSYGSYTSMSANGFISQRFKRFGFLASVSSQYSKGDYSFLDDNGTPLNSSDDQSVNRQNNKSISFYPFVKLTYNFDDHTDIEIITHVIKKHQGIPGLSSNQSQTADLSKTEWMQSIKLNKNNFFSPKLATQQQFYFRYSQMQYSDPNSEIGLGGAQDNNDQTVMLGHRAHFDIFIGRSVILKYLVDYQFERFLPQNYLVSPSRGSSSHRHRLGNHAGAEIALLKDRLFLNPHVSLVHVFNGLSNNDPSFSGVSPFANNKTHHELMASVKVTGKLNKDLTAEFQSAREVRFPQFHELFGDRGFVVGNTNLVPQTSVSWDAGLLFQRQPKKFWLKKIEASVSYFHRYVDNLIQFQQTASVARAENVGQAFIRGLEMQAYLKLWDYLDLSSNYTWQLAKDKATNPGRLLPGRPKHELTSQVGLTYKKTKAHASLTWMDANFLDPLNTRVVNSRFLIGLGASYQLGQKWRLSAEGKNLTNQQIVDVLGFPLPGRSFFVKVGYEM